MTIPTFWAGTPVNTHNGFGHPEEHELQVYADVRKLKESVSWSCVCVC